MNSRSLRILTILSVWTILSVVLDPAGPDLPHLGAAVTIAAEGANQPPTARIDARPTTREDTPLVGTLEASDPENDALTFRVIDPPEFGALTLDAATGAYRFLPNPDFNGADMFTFRASDGKSDSNVGTVIITVTAVNDPPVAQDQQLALAAGAAEIRGRVTATDVEASALIYRVLTFPSQGLVRLAAGSGEFVYTPNPNFSGSDRFTFTANDGTDDSNIATVTITAPTVGGLPAAHPDRATTAEDTAVTLADLLANDDLGRGPTTVTGFDRTSRAGGTVQNAGNNRLTYTPKPDFNGDDQFRYTITDANHNSSQTTVTVTVQAMNDAPVAADGRQLVAANTPAAGTLAATDVDYDRLRFSLVDPPRNGSVRIDAATGAYTYTPKPNFSGDDRFSFKANDGTADSNVATITVTVQAAPNHAPEAQDAAATTRENTPLAGSLTATDADSDAVRFSVVTGPKEGSVKLDPKTGKFSYTPNRNFAGTDAFTFKAGDGKLDSAPATVTITVTTTDHAPAAQDGTAAAPEDTPLRGKLAATDPDGDRLTFRIVDAAAHGTITLEPATGAFIYTPNPNFNGNDRFTFSASDGKLASNVATVTITVDPVNDAPTAADDRQTTPEDAPVRGSLSATDVDGDKLTFSVQELPMNGALTVAAATGAYTYTPNPNFNGRDSFTFSASDGKLASNVATVTITVDPVNDAPVTQGDATPTTPENTAYVGTLWATDVDRDPITFLVVDHPRHGAVTLDAASGRYTYTPNPDFTGDDTMRFKSNDGKLDGNIVTVTIAVTGDAESHQVTFTSIGAQDGWVEESRRKSRVGGAAASDGRGQNALRVGDDEHGRQLKSIVAFDTASLPDDAVLISVRLRLRRGTISGSIPFDTFGPLRVDVRTGGFGGDTALAPEDFQAPANATAAGVLSNPRHDRDWSEAKLNKAGMAAINRVGITQFRIYFKLDTNGDRAPNQLGFYSGDDDAPENYPELVIVYEDANAP